MNDCIVITGLGLVCPMGHDVETVWEGMLTGKHGFAKTTIFDASTFPSTFCAEVKDYDLSKFTKNPELHKDSNRGSGFVIGATAEACKQAGIEIEADEPGDGIDRKRIGINRRKKDQDNLYTSCYPHVQRDSHDYIWSIGQEPGS